ncbi:hypothetical protein M514_11292 [Trichuris suis]|uniref:Uncharacterized protein n=1 Tax=Trichuris suis TaxID=68888 RepID=A0A085MXS1_9BILA|nr:hypothetical protein M513_11292 [Trichuris suis]KFD62017.1 hypothetical protein M514_11292 [Trichuris suis]
MIMSQNTEGNQGESCDKKEENAAKKIPTDRLIQLTSELLKGLEQRSFITEQELNRNIHMLQDKLIRERPKHVKQTNLKGIFKKMIKDKAAKESLFENPMP